MTFNPEESTYHAILEKTYGRETAISMLKQATTEKPIRRAMRNCFDCKRLFKSRSAGKIYCGDVDKKGTCSYRAAQIRKAVRGSLRWSAN